MRLLALHEDTSWSSLDLQKVGKTADGNLGIAGKKKNKKEMVPLGIEPRTYCVLSRCDNQLHHGTLLKAVSERKPSRSVDRTSVCALAYLAFNRLSRNKDATFCSVNYYQAPFVVSAADQSVGLTSRKWRNFELDMV